MDFPSEFNKSPFGNNWQNKINVKYNLDSAMDVNIFSALDLCLMNRSRSYIDSKLNYRAQKDSFLSFILVKKDSDIIDKPIKTHDLERDKKFSIDDFERFMGVSVGYGFIDKKISDSQLNKLIDDHLLWLFKNKDVLSENHRKTLFKFAKESVDEKKNNTFGWLLSLILELIKQDIETLMKIVIVPFLHKVKIIIENQLIIDENAWKYTISGQINSEYYSPFIPDFNIVNSLSKKNDDVINKFKSKIEKYSSTLKVDPLLLISGNNHREANNKLEELLNYAFNVAISSIGSLYTDIINAIEAILEIIKGEFALANAFLVGLYNGILNIGIGIIDLLIMFFDKDKFNDFINSIESLFKAIKDNGLLSVLSEFIKAFVQKYEENDGVYDFIKILIEDIAELLIEILFFFLSGGGKTVATIVQQLQKITSTLVKKTGKISIKDLKDLTKPLRDLKKNKDADSQDFNESNNPNINVERKQILNDVESGKADLTLDADGKKRKSHDQTRKGNYAQLKVDDYFESSTFKIGKNEGTLKSICLNKVGSLDDRVISGIDTIYEFSNPPPKYLISEVKYGTSSLSRTITKTGGSQMQDSWIEGNLIKAVGKNKAIEIASDGYQSILSKVSNDGKIINKLLDDNANIKGNWNGNVTN